MRVNAQGWLERDRDDDPELEIVATWKKYNQLDTPDGRPDGVVWHYTAFTGLDPLEHCRRQQRDYPNASTREASWHVEIGRRGLIVQIASFLHGTWHVGGATNKTKVGIELENYGRLKKLGGFWHCWPYYRSNNAGNPDPKLGPHPKYRVPEFDARSARGEGVFHDFTEAQVGAAEKVLGALVDAYAWDRDACTLGHADLADASVREDPGPLWGCRKWPGIYLPRIISNLFDNGEVILGEPEVIS